MHPSVVGLYSGCAGEVQTKNGSERLPLPSNALVFWTIRLLSSRASATAGCDFRSELAINITNVTLGSLIEMINLLQSVVRVSTAMSRALKLARAHGSIKS